MKKTLLTTMTIFSASLLMTGCGQNIPYVNTDTEEECATVSRNLLKVEKFTQSVEKASAFHLEEAAIALDNPKISVSNNKAQMLRDASKRKAALEAEQVALGCDVETK